MTETDDKAGLSVDFNSKLKSTIKRNVVYKNFVSIVLIGGLKSVMVVITTLLEVFTGKKENENKKST